MATDQPPTIVPSSVMGPEVLAMLIVVRSEVARTIEALNRLTGGAHG
jgi:hypothetical protein